MGWPGRKYLILSSELSLIESARLALARGARGSDPELVRSMHQVARVAASTLGVERVGVWTIEDSWQKMRCVVLYDQRTREFAPGSVLELSKFPAYARALKERRVIAAQDALSDPRTCELADSYLKPNDVLSLLDCPVYEAGEVVAIVCHESVGRVRSWSERDRDFAASVADIAATLFAQLTLLRFEGELRAAREALAHARVMDSLGRMAAGVAHDFNNMLMGISLAVRLAEEELPAGSSGRAAIGDAIQLVDQGARLVKHLLTFARQGVYSGKPVDAQDCTQKMLPRLRRLLGSDVELTAEFDAKPALIRLDAAMLEQVILNLVVNAKDAMPGGGTITIRSSNDGASLSIGVQDTGLGMAPDVRERIFEPFYTTRTGSGTGLGLAIVFGAVQSAGGTIVVESEPGRGSLFTLELPLVLNEGRHGS